VIAPAASLTRPLISSALPPMVELQYKRND
jgi:hypothetical protein